MKTYKPTPRYFVVHNQHTYPIGPAHVNIKSAIKEAREFAALNPDSVFFVCKTVLRVTAGKAPIIEEAL